MWRWEDWLGAGLWDGLQAGLALVLEYLHPLLLLAMGLLTWAALRLLQLLEEISELEEHVEQPTSPDSKSLPPASPRKGDNSDGARESRSRRRRGARRSLSLPSGTLSYGDCRILYVNGHFVREPLQPEDEASLQDVVDFLRSPSDSSQSEISWSSGGGRASRSSGSSLLDVGAELSMREDFLYLLESQISAPDSVFSSPQPLDWNYNHVRGGHDPSSPSVSSSVVSTLPRSRRREREVGNRPLSVDESQIRQNLALYGQQHLGQGPGVGRGPAVMRSHSLGVGDRADAEGMDSSLSAPCSPSKFSDSDRTKGKNPNFLQKILSRRKSFNDKAGKPPRGDSGQGRDVTVARKVSLRGLFRRKSVTDAKGGSSGGGGREGAASPPIAAFLQDEDIGAVSSLPGSPYVRRGHRGSVDTGMPEAGTRRGGDDDRISLRSLDISHPLPAPVSPPVPHQQQAAGPGGRVQPAKPTSAKPETLPRRRRESSSSGRHPSVSLVQDRSSGEFSLGELDTSADYNDLDETLTPTSLSPSTSSSMTAEGDATLTATPLGADRTPGPGSLRPRCVRQDSGSGLDKMAGVVRGEITASNSNDSGIQHDVNTHSSYESLKLVQDAVTGVPVNVKLRQTPSPKQERPKSDITVRWADLENALDHNVAFFRDGSKLRKRPRPKSDLGGSSLFGETMKAFGGSVGSLYRHDSLRSLAEMRRLQSGDTMPAGQRAGKGQKTSRRMSTPQPIKNRLERNPQRTKPKRVTLVRSHSMPENLDKLHKRRNFLSLIGYCAAGTDAISLYSQHSGVDDSSDESEYSLELSLRDKCPSTRSSQSALATLDELIEEENTTYAEALWDHVTMDPDELGFRAGDLIRVVDMSDKDWWFGNIQEEEGWFPASFVRLRVNQEAVEEEMTLATIEEVSSSPKLKHHASHINKDQGRTNVVNEIINAEREYVKHLRGLVEGYLKQAKKRPEMFSEDKVNTIFGNLEKIYSFAERFLAELELCFSKDAPHNSKIGHVFLKHSAEFEIYSDYCNNHPAACEELKELYRNKRYKHFFEACRLLQEMIEIPLEGFLLTPVQKICKYHLQLAELLKYTVPEHPDRPAVQGALDAMRSIATLINERKRKMESIEKLTAWQLGVDDWEGPDLLDTSSELIYTGELNKINANGWSQERTFFLFDHQLIYCKRDILKKNSYGYKGRIVLDHSEIIPLDDGKDAQYNVTVRHAWKIHDTHRDKWFLLVAKSDTVKQRWLKAFQDERRRVKDDQENNFNIPHHLKQRAINNIKQKANLNKPKGLLLWLSKR